jgi:hypothetical protein
MLSIEKKLSKIEQHYFTDFNFRSIVHFGCYSSCCLPKTILHQYQDLNLSREDFISFQQGIQLDRNDNEFSKFGRILGREGKIYHFMNNVAEIVTLLTSPKDSYHGLVAKLQFNIENLAMKNNFPWLLCFLSGLEEKIL